jgi:ATP-binding cassette, subfamily F, member 3
MFRPTAVLACRRSENWGIIRAVITLRNVSKSFGHQVLLESVSLQINEKDRFALIGPNGAGKSTLFKLILGELEPDEGTIALRSGVTFGYLPQETTEFARQHVLEEVVGDAMTDSTRIPRAKKILVGLGFRQTDFERSISELSGGWQMRVAIARLLLDEPDLLMLDEPTNHLDLETLLWFQDFLQNYRGAIFLISHDREFMNSIVSRMVEVRERKLHMYTGSFEDYLAQKKQDEENLISAYHRQQKEIKELEDFINKFRAKASTASRAQAKIKYLEKMERIQLPESLQTVGFSFPQPARSGQNVLMLKNIRQSYDDGKTWVYDGLDLTLERGQKIALVGPNGAGKSTLIKLLAGAIPYQSGEKKVGFNVEVGYFSQHRAEMFRPGKTVLEEAMNTQRHHKEQTVRTLLGSFLFKGDSVFKPVEVLSGGEKSRLGLARLLLDPPNLMLLDEPTTHLDMASVDVLVEALKAFEGNICFISHDVYFIRQLADHVIHVKQGKVTWYPGDYDYFLHKKSQEESEEGELFRSEERIEKAHHTSVSSSPTATGGGRTLGEGKDNVRPLPETAGDDVMKVPSVPRKTKEQKRLEAEQRQAKYRQEQELKRKQDVLKQLKETESLLLSEMARLETHQNPARVKDLSQRLGDIQKQIKSLQ